MTKDKRGRDVRGMWGCRRGVGGALEECGRGVGGAWKSLT